MNTVKNLQVNRKAKCLNKKTIFKLIVGVAVAGVLATTIPMAITAHNNSVEEKQNTAIVTYYGEDSIESKIVEYIKLSEKLNKLNLEKFNIDESLFKKHNIFNELKTPQEIEGYIEKFNGINSFVSTKDINKQSENIDIVLNLVAQEKNVNSYIYNTGYSIANKNITSATKEYTAEVFGVENPENIYFNYHKDSYGENSTKVENHFTNKHGFVEKESYNFDNVNETKEEKNINKGVIDIIKTDVSGDQMPGDNEKYNEERNDIIREALTHSIDLENLVNDYNLYNAKMDKKMK